MTIPAFSSLASDSSRTPPTRERHPVGLLVLFFTELWERFGFYTMSAILTLYVKGSRQSGGLGMNSTQALNYWGYYSGSVYFTPLFGGILADTVLGERLAISIGAVLLAAGYFLLALPPGEGLTLFFLALGCIALGNGLFKPNISTIVGKLYREDSPLRDSAFNIFYMGINLGALFAPFAAAFLRKQFNWQAPFAGAGVGMLISLIIFTVFSRHFGKSVQAPRIASSMGSGGEVNGDERNKHSVGMAGRLAALLILYLVSTMFWCLFFQNGGVLTLWADDCTRRAAWLSPELFQAVNPFCIVVLSGVAAWVWQHLGRQGKEPAAPDKILLGLGVAVLACLMMVAASLAGGDACLPGGTGTRVSLFWLVGTYILMSLAEILVSPMGLSYCTRVAPGRGGGLVMGGWFVSLSGGGYLSGHMGSGLWEQLAHSRYFALLAGGTAAVALLLLLCRKVLIRAGGK